MEKIFFVMEEINLSSELHNRNRFIFIRIGKLPDITKEEQTTIIFRLIGDKIVKENYWVSILTDHFLLDLNDSFFDFYDKVKLQLAKMNKQATNRKIISHKLSFDIEKSILYFMGYKIPITLKNSKPNAHYILEHIFTAEDGLDQKCPYKEIAEDTFDEIYEKWKIYYRACENINQKVLNKTGVNDFLEFSSGKSGWVKINDKYL
ncbi:MAG: hypothetical protein KAT05_09610, partial [Spirochaetes bacterium]|nr:hypothetical protein [Spirochaetota bacterium]